MEQQIINEVICQMMPHLSNDQMVLLKNVLEGAIIKAGNESVQTDEDLLESFIAAKRLEGCSERTLAFYKKTIEKMLSVVAKNVKAITTEDLRGYLSEYQNNNLFYSLISQNYLHILFLLLCLLQQKTLDERFHPILLSARPLHS